jgi:hypothetical protein
MSIATFVFLGIFAALFLYAVTMYNNFVRLKNNIAQAWSNIDVLLKQRHDELPKWSRRAGTHAAQRGVLEKSRRRAPPCTAHAKRETWLPSGLPRPSCGQGS